MNNATRSTPHGLDVNTPRGQKTTADERYMLENLSRRWGDQLIPTDKSRPAVVDGVAVRQNTIIGVFESKCRYESLDCWLNKYGSWLITWKKVEGCAQIAKGLACPLFGLLYLVNGERVYWWKICTREGLFTVPLDIQNTVTQATCNGGRAKRDNLYIPLKIGTWITLTRNQNAENEAK